MVALSSSATQHRSVRSVRAGIPEEGGRRGGPVRRSQRSRRQFITGTWLGGLFGVVMLFVGMASPMGIWGGTVGLLITIGSIACGIIFGRIVYPVEVCSSYARFKGCGERFLESLPPVRQ